MTTRAVYMPGSGAEKTENFFDSLVLASQEDNGRAKDSAVEAVLDSVGNTPGVSMPESAEKLVSAMQSDSGGKFVFDSVLRGIDLYRKAHGVLPSADVIEAALSQGLAAAKPPMALFDSTGSSNHSDPSSAQAGRVIVSVTSALAEAIPCVMYLPVDMNSNEAKLGIVSHLAGSSFGDYTQNDLMDGVSSGNSYISSERILSLSTNGGGLTPITGTFKAKSDNTGAAIQVIRYRTIVSVNGNPVAYEALSNPSSNVQSPITGMVTISGTTYTISGFIEPSTGNYSVSASANLPANTVIELTAYVDYETTPALTPEMITQVTTYSLYASPWRVKGKQSIDSKSQYANELGVDLAGEALIAVRNQYANERHYNILKRAKVLAINNTKTFDFAYSTQIAQKTRAQILQDLQAIIGATDQQMAEDTMDHGITHLYVGKNLMAMLLSMGSDQFTPSGITSMPGIYRVGRLFGRYEVYYSPKIIVEGSTTTQILCLGRSNQVARCPFVMGDAVPPTYLPLAFGDDMKYGSGFYARNFNSVNPHAPSAKGVALINITNLF